MVKDASTIADVVSAANKGGTTGQALTLDNAVAGWALPAGEVHVWRASLERPAQTVERMRRLLASDEQRRADRFRFERDRSRYVVGRALLRGLLARYMGAEPEELEFEYGEFRKPAVREGPWFNVSHSGPIVLYAFSSGGEVGIDVELDDADFARERIAERFFSPSEVGVLRSLPAGVQPRAFLTCWTRKEAFIKARGDGLSLALDSFDVTIAPDTPAAVLRTAWCSEEARQWCLEDLSDRRGGYIAAVAVRGEEWRVVEQELGDKTEGRMPGQEHI
jgi:4'-phosphopantetheinyl transferase